MGSWSGRFWRDVEPRPGEYNWSYIDSQIDAAAQHQKHVVLTVIPGAWTPDWARAGVQQSDFTIKYGHKKGEPDLLPLPWDQTYLGRWFNFVKALGARYDSNPAVVMIPATGPTATTAEMSLPNQPEAVRKWIQLGYTPKKYEAAWDQTCAVYSEAFPTTLIGLTLYPGLPIPDNKEKVKTRETVVAQAQKRLDGRMAIQTSGLSARKEGRPHRHGGYGFVEGDSGQVTTGFQCGTSASERPERMGSSDPVQALRRTIDFGLEAKIDFLEIYENDITNPAQQKNIQYAHNQLTGR